ncbi:MAG: PTS glucitol/sorbitol transporter subunit IIC [Absicoccus porci]|jgi:PTS system glucitol/sorbitol-specific IIC component|uniref:PTS sorbitol transporter subunit IIC n=1 Tax=Absicoccus porci TaxID=2486576 RepID=A0A3N0I2Q0_9FIRM|nr:PTS glucitol/sorbitol transporter subunit IIC [Absicoccus porci]MCI6087522.1 PTS glucitol/sorbitol transporter subunit IIC [Absicoccus porci]MDD6460713.1 PTS glucitol/sorbitol transporter subunit IIC [Absicoccus porci]MDD7330641.1 PTS glucitol/sorbitol transporter subunit IIC [Absicoccus porci]MDY4738511.1 PTS glucitol/sorbitol transporter subunit IIC [Absicoccus porci]MEE1355648.1 PTS glucitol/sorbitol transporter subunit IIC [Absicoccus porci]
MEVLSNIAQGFMSLFTTGGKTFTGWVTSIIPMIVCLLTFMNSIIKLVGEDRVNRFTAKLTKYAILRYTLMPMIGLIFLGNPMGYSIMRFCDEKDKPAMFDVVATFAHPVTGLFPHANAGELFVYMGIASGIQELGLPLGDLAIRYFIAGIIMCAIRGYITQGIYMHLTAAESAE